MLNFRLAGHCCRGKDEIVATFGAVARKGWTPGQFSLPIEEIIRHPKHDETNISEFNI